MPTLPQRRPSSMHPVSPTLRYSLIVTILTVVCFTTGWSQPTAVWTEEAPDSAAQGVWPDEYYVVPAWIWIPRLGTEAPIVALGLEEDGTMASPTDPDDVGWYELGPGIGGPGNAILAGHVDWGGRLRAFGLLRNLRAGDAIYLWDHSGNEYLYRVERSEWVDADAAPDSYFSQGAVEEITLITCGGVFDTTSREYLSRLIVRAVREYPASEPEPTWGY